MVDHIVDSTEMIYRFDDVINGDTLTDIYRVRFKNQSRLVLAELASLNVVGVISHAHLQFMVQTSRQADAFFISQHLQQGIICNAPAEIFLIAAQERSNFCEYTVRDFLSTANFCYGS